MKIKSSGVFRGLCEALDIPRPGLRDTLISRSHTVNIHHRFSSTHYPKMITYTTYPHPTISHKRSFFRPCARLREVTPQRSLRLIHTILHTAPYQLHPLSPPNPHSSTHEPVSACLLPWHVCLLIHTHGVGLVILLRDGDVRVTNRSDALIFSKSQSGTNRSDALVGV